MSDEGLSRALAREVTRHPAPPHLRAAVTETLTPPLASRRAAWVPSALAALATALVLVLFFVPLLPHTAPADPLQRLARAVVAEHTRVLLWGARRPDIVPAALPWLTQETGIAFASVFAGDDRLTLDAAEPVYLERRRGLALHYRDDEGRHLTYVVLPAPGLTMPERRRVQAGRWRPALVHDNGFSVLVWKQGELACFLVSAMGAEADLQQFKDYFVRVRAATEPVPAS